MRPRLTLINSYYELTRVPLWILNDQGQLLYCFPEEDSQLARVLKPAVLSLPFHYDRTTFQAHATDCELYIMFSTEEKAEDPLNLRIIAGPFLLNTEITGLRLHSLSFSGSLSPEELSDIVAQLPSTSFYRSAPYLQHLMGLFDAEPVSLEKIRQLALGKEDAYTQSTLVENLFSNQENLRLHTPYAEEKAVLNCIKEGDLKRLESTYHSLPEVVYGKMSNQPDRQLFYGCIANTTLVTRYAIEGGLDEETAFTLSDIYIQRMERCRSAIELNQLNEEMAVDFTTRVHESKQNKLPAYSRPVIKCIEYIAQNTHQKLTLDILADQVGLTPKYLSFLFHKETGSPLRVYVEQQKIQEAKNLLLYTQYSYSEISEYLAFSSQSHFISVFKKNIGMTPKEFRESQST